VGGIRIYQGASGMWFATREAHPPLFVTASSEEELHLALKRVEDALVNGR
jgi:hypothetical protein